MSDQSIKDDAFWRDKLSEEEYRICRGKGTERAFTGEYYETKSDGVYRCRCCQTALFDAGTKYDSGSGWPSFYEALDKSKISETVDRSMAQERVEITCANCGCHLGHVFPDGPTPTGTRYCVNSLSLKLDEK